MTSTEKLGKEDLTLQLLIERLHIIFQNECVDVEEVQHAMESYNPAHRDWQKYANFDPHRYTRNLVDTGNGKFNLILLCWGEGHGSGVHDHANAHCWMKVVDGTLFENQYEWPNSEHTEITPELYNAMTKKKVTEFKTGEVAYINDSIGLHRVENNSHSACAVSLHLYSPPFEMCQSFDERTGKSSSVKVIFCSKYGERTPFGSNSKAVIAEHK